MSEHEILAGLRAAGFDVDRMPEELKRALSGLTEEEVATLLAVKERLSEALPDVEGHQYGEEVIGGIFF